MDKGFKELPKSVKKVIRYIYQDANYDQLLSLNKHVNQAIKLRLKEYNNSKKSTND